MLNPQHALPIENQGLDPKLFNQVVAITQSIPAHQHLHMHLLSLAPGKARLQMPTNPAFSNSYGLTHGGLIATFTDSAMGVALRTLNLRAVTVEINLNFLAPVKVDQILTVTAYKVHLGSQLVVAEAEVFNPDKKLVAKSRATFYRVGKLLDSV
ncbi:MAG: PaaI family thioesterase [Syntrophomonadaceae bacterium]|nr:PaaI family thioesterase [Syntrophomonadaceae bacterium]